VQFETGNDHGAYRVILNFDSNPHAIEIPGAGWRRLLNSADPQWSESPSGDFRISEFQVQPYSCVLLASFKSSSEERR
jgi:hypothetical protein